MIWHTHFLSPVPLDILFRQIAMFIKAGMAFVFGLQTLELIEFSKNISIKGSAVQKPWLYKILWMLWFDEKSISNMSCPWLVSQFFPRHN